LLHTVNGLRVRVTANSWKAAASLLKRKCNANFQGYRPETLRRRMEARITVTGSRSPAEYVARLRKDDAELEKLRSALLVKVSAFHRDPQLWRLLEKRCLTQIAKIERKRELRMWSAGCATGEEAYTLAMLTLSLSRGPRALKVFGTDLDEPALAQARIGRYPRSAIDHLPRTMARRFFSSENDSRKISAELRRHVIFGRHDLLRDPPLSSMHLVACRNVLIYLKPVERKEVVGRLAASLRPGGILFLGKAEGASLPSPDFERVAPGAPIFRRTNRPAQSTLATPTRLEDARSTKTPTSGGTEPILFAVNTELAVTMWSRAAEVFFAVRSEHALGRTLFDLVPRPSQLTRASLKSAMTNRKRSRLPDFTVTTNGIRRALAIEVTPLPKRTGLMFIGTPRATMRKGRRSNLDAELTGREMQEHMDSQQTLNEELQSRNEELETVNEELQSLNDEIQVQGDEARRATLFLGALLDAGPDVVIGCDRQGKVSYWGSPAVRRFGLSSAQALGKDLLRLVPQLDVAGLRKLVRKSTAWPKKGRRTRRVVKVSKSLHVAIFPALDGDGTAHGTLLRVLEGRTK
jgi:two-component system, chemotaxis family, CheB/CheR fusion protein